MNECTLQSDMFGFGLILMNIYLPLKSLSFNFMFIKIVDMSDYGLIFKILGLFSDFVTHSPLNFSKSSSTL